MDIVITVPKSEYENIEKENDIYFKNTDEYEQFWTLTKTPKKIEVGDRIYFIKHKQIDHSMRITRIENDSETHCDVTNRNWKGKCQLFLDDYQKENIDLEVKGFQGFRYKWW